MTPTLLISMTVVGLALLIAVLLMIAGVSLLVVLLRESHKLDDAGEVQKKIAAVAANHSSLKHGLESLEELVATKLNRIATTSKRDRKKAREEDLEEDQEFPSDLEFPSLKRN